MAKNAPVGAPLALRVNPNDVLNDLLDVLRNEARRGVKEVIQLEAQANALIKPVMALDGDDKLRGLERIGHGLKSGLAAIANEHLRAIFDNLIANSLAHARNIVQVGLGTLTKGF